MLLQVAISPSLLYENTYEPIPGYLPKAPTVSQVPTEIRGALDMTIFNAGMMPIEVRSSSSPYIKIKAAPAAFPQN